MAVLFSGGVDCTVLALLTHWHLSANAAEQAVGKERKRIQSSSNNKNDNINVTIDNDTDAAIIDDEPIDLINIAFQGTKNPSEIESSPDRAAAIHSLSELRRLAPSRNWRLIRVNVTLDDLEKHRESILALSYPRQTIMDFNIGAMLYFGARGVGVLEDPSSLSSTPASSMPASASAGEGSRDAAASAAASAAAGAASCSSDPTRRRRRGEPRKPVAPPPALRFAGDDGVMKRNDNDDCVAAGGNSANVIADCDDDAAAAKEGEKDVVGNDVDAAADDVDDDDVEASIAAGRLMSKEERVARKKAAKEAKIMMYKMKKGLIDTASSQLTTGDEAEDEDKTPDHDDAASSTSAPTSPPTSPSASSTSISASSTSTSASNTSTSASNTSISASSTSTSASNTSTSSLSSQLYRSRAPVLILGSGADEQLGGYGRHRTSWRLFAQEDPSQRLQGRQPQTAFNLPFHLLQQANCALRRELDREVMRLWTRNLGRDDRLLSHWGREGRHPFLDEEVLGFLWRFGADHRDMYPTLDVFKRRAAGDAAAQTSSANGGTAVGAVGAVDAVGAVGAGAAAVAEVGDMSTSRSSAKLVTGRAVDSDAGSVRIEMKSDVAVGGGGGVGGRGGEGEEQDEGDSEAAEALIDYSMLPFSRTIFTESSSSSPTSSPTSSTSASGSTSSLPYSTLNVPRIDYAAIVAALEQDPKTRDLLMRVCTGNTNTNTNTSIITTDTTSPTTTQSCSISDSDKDTSPPSSPRFFHDPLPFTLLCDLRDQPGVGDKRLLRGVASALGLTSAGRLVKRAMQFGTKVANKNLAGTSILTRDVPTAAVVNQQMVGLGAPTPAQIFAAKRNKNNKRDAAPGTAAAIESEASAAAAAAAAAKAAAKAAASALGKKTQQRLRQEMLQGGRGASSGEGA